MAIIRKKDIKNMNAADLKSKLKDLQFEMIKMNAQRTAKTSAGRFKEIRRTIARIHTQLKTIEGKKT